MLTEYKLYCLSYSFEDLNDKIKFLVISLALYFQRKGQYYYFGNSVECIKYKTFIDSFKTISLMIVTNLCFMKTTKELNFLIQESSIFLKKKI